MMFRTVKEKHEKRKVFIFVEGKTEKLYFDFLKQKLRLSNAKIATVVLDNSGKNWIEKADRIMKRDKKFKCDKTTDVFIIFDKDNINSEEYSIILKQAQSQDIQIGFSNVMFEVWLLGHYESVSSYGISKEKLLNKLSVHLGQKYEKANSDQIKKMVEFHETAIQNTGSITEMDYNKQSTNIGSIIKLIKRG